MEFSESIDDYSVKELLGKGGFATVHRAIYKGQNVAIKFVDKNLMQKNNLVERIRQEVAIHSRLKHPSIIALHTFFEDSNYVYLVLELCEKELYQYWKDNTDKLTEYEISNIIRQIALGIEYLHSHDIIHRDISLGNILLTKNMDAKISDFGLSAYISNSKLKTFCGTPNYISPEVVLKNEYSFPVDIWGLGSVLYTLIVGCPPFGKNSSIKSTLTQVVMGELLIPAEVSFEAKDLIHKLLCRDPNKRIRIQEVLQHPFITKYQQQKFPSRSPKSEAITLKIKPFNAARLQPVRYRTKTAVLSILQNQEIVIEFLKNIDHVDRVMDVCRISSDGLRIVIYQPNKPDGVIVRDDPADIPESGAEYIFSYENLPTKYYKKYLYAARFVEMVRAKTPKIVFYSNDAKCQLMESLVDFEVHFYNGFKYFQLVNQPKKFLNAAGDELDVNSLTNHFYLNLLKHCEDCFQHCQTIEETMSQIEEKSVFSAFPVIVGRRPAQNDSNVKNNTFNNYISASQTTFKSPNLQISSFLY